MFHSYSPWWLALLATSWATEPATALGAYVPRSNVTAPVVDLGYEIHRAVVDPTASYFNFSNIRYGEPPVGDLRFRAPVAPITINRYIQEAPENRICFQSSGAWQAVAGPFLGSIIAGPNATLAGGVAPPPPSGDAPAPPPLGAGALPGLETDDCLFLDVFAPQSVFNAAQGHAGNLNSGAPVLLWIHGGGHVNGWKNQVGSPAGMLNESLLDGRQGIVFVEINYRLGLFGYPPRKQGDDSFASNAGLLDQRLAITWVQKYISLFGGNPNDITLMGESAGANSILHHLTSFGGSQGPLPFRKAILQSPAWRPTTDAVFYETLLARTLAAGNITSLDQARNFTGAQVQAINNAIVGASAYATFDFGTNIDGGYIPEAPGVLLATGQYDRSVALMVGHNSNEGLLFTDPSVNDQAAFESNLANFAPRASPAQIKTVSEVLYPDDLSGVHGYTTQTERLSITMREGVVENYAFGLETALGRNLNNTFSYVFGEFPGIHAQDLSYTFFSGESADAFGLPIVTNLAKLLQSGVIQFALTADPNVPGGDLPRFPLYGPDAQSLFFNSTVIANVTDSDASTRSKFWQTELYNVSISSASAANAIVALAEDV